MKKPFFSIIIPAYQAASFLSTSIDSILGQSYDDFEIVLADDGSTDGTNTLIAKYMSDDNRIRLLSLSHSGVSAARNAGLDAAEGEYVLFLDSDDALVPDALEKIKNRVSDKPDMVWFGFIYREEGKPDREDKKMKDTRYPDIDAALNDWTVHSGQFPVSASNKVFRLSSIRARQIRFREKVSFGEDRLFNLDFLKECRGIEIMSDNLYIYTIRKGSGSHRYVPDTIQVFLSLYREKTEIILTVHGKHMTEDEKQAFSQREFFKALTLGWKMLMETWPYLSENQQKQELKGCFKLNIPKHFDRSVLDLKTKIWFRWLILAVRLRSVQLLRSLMRINRRNYKKNET